VLCLRHAQMEDDPCGDRSHTKRISATGNTNKLESAPHRQLPQLRPTMGSRTRTWPFSSAGTLAAVAIVAETADASPGDHMNRGRWLEYREMHSSCHLASSGDDGSTGHAGKLWEVEWLFPL